MASSLQAWFKQASIKLEIFGQELGSLPGAISEPAKIKATGVNALLPLPSDANVQFQFSR